MKKVTVDYRIALTLLGVGLFLGGCEPSSTPEPQDAQQPSTEETGPQTQAALKSGNMFYMVRDIADMQLKAGEYISQLQVTQHHLQTAIEQQDQQQLKQTASILQQQLTGLNQALTALHLKTEEINTIRENVISANEQVLASPFLNGQVNFDEVDFTKIQQQMNTIQTEMLKLASLMIPESKPDPSPEKP